MVFVERKTEKGFAYSVEDLFGKIEIKSFGKLDAKVLDELTMQIISRNLRTGGVEDKISFEYFPNDNWSEDEDLQKWKEINETRWARNWNKFLAWFKSWYN